METASTTPSGATADTRLCPVSRKGNRAEVALNIHGTHFSSNLYAIYDEVREQCPIAYSTEHDGFWLLTDYAATFEATRDDDLFTSTSGTGITTTRESLENSIATVSPPLHTDPPLTAAMRKLTLPFLSPAKAEELEPLIRRIATEQIDSFIEDGEADLVNQLTTPLPARIILHLLGFDESGWPQWVSYIHGIVHGQEEGGQGLTREQASEGIAKAINVEMERRATGNVSNDDITSVILNGEVLGRQLTTQEKFGYILLLLFGGMDTTSGLTGNTLFQLSKRPELKQQLIDRPEIMPTAVEEFLRHGTPTQGLARTVARDAEFHGQQLKEGDRVLLLWASANRDPSVFDNAAELDLERKPNRHLSFGVGQHRCLGSNLARTMFRIMLEEILQRLPDFSMIDDQPDVFPDAYAVYAPRTMRVRFTPGQRRATTLAQQL